MGGNTSVSAVGATGFDILFFVVWSNFFFVSVVWTFCHLWTPMPQSILWSLFMHWRCCLAILSTSYANWSTYSTTWSTFYTISKHKLSYFRFYEESYMWMGHHVENTSDFFCLRAFYTSCHHWEVLFHTIYLFSRLRGQCHPWIRHHVDNAAVCALLEADWTGHGCVGWDKEERKSSQRTK